MYAVVILASWPFHVLANLKKENENWWGHKHGFISGGFLGAKLHSARSCSRKESQPDPSKRKTFAEEDQENLYKLVQAGAFQKILVQPY